MPNTKKIELEKSDIGALEDRGKRLDDLIKEGISEKSLDRRLPMSFDQFLLAATFHPERVFRDIFQVFYDMIFKYIPGAKDDYFEKEDQSGFLDFDTSDLFVNNFDSPFFADRLFAKRLIDMAIDFKKGASKNYIYLFEGPPGSGKSTFLNNLLHKLEEYTTTEEGSTYKLYWKLDIKMLGGFQRIERRIQKIAEEFENGELNHAVQKAAPKKLQNPERFIEFSCPNHDHPFLILPKNFRRKFFDELIPDKKFLKRLYSEKQYEWVLKEEPCHICSSIYKSILEERGDPKILLSMVNARKNYYNRQLGEGISVFNPGDPMFVKPLYNPLLQTLINDVLKHDDVKFKFSYLAKTNNGVLALMDIKEFNAERLKAYHGIISDGVHKVDLAEERIKSLFVGLVNPEDKVHYEKIKSFQDRIITVKIPYVLDYDTEVSIYKSKFGGKVAAHFLPRVIENFAKIIVSSRLDKESPVIKKWIDKPERYNKYIDKNMLLLKMDIYSGSIPNYLTEEDIKKFNKQIRKEMIAASENEGCKGISGRLSLNVFSAFLAKHASSEKLVTMEMVRDFFKNNKELADKGIPEGFIDSIVDLYDYNTVQEIKEAIYYFNDKQISNDIQNYLFAINFDPGETKKCEYTGEVIEITEDYFKNFEALFLGATSTALQRQYFRKDIHAEYITTTLSREIKLDGKAITETTQYKSLYDKYVRNLKENALTLYADNQNFRRAILDFGSQSFNSYDERLKRDINRLLSNLKKKFGYTAEGARQACLYILDKNIIKKY